MHFLSIHNFHILLKSKLGIEDTTKLNVFQIYFGQQRELFI